MSDYKCPPIDSVNCLIRVGQALRCRINISIAKKSFSAFAFRCFLEVLTRQHSANARNVFPIIVLKGIFLFDLERRRRLLINANKHRCIRWMSSDLSFFLVAPLFALLCLWQASTGKYELWEKKDTKAGVHFSDSRTVYGKIFFSIISQFQSLSFSSPTTKKTEQNDLKDFHHKRHRVSGT